MSKDCDAIINMIPLNFDDDDRPTDRRRCLWSLVFSSCPSLSPFCISGKKGDSVRRNMSRPGGATVNFGLNLSSRVSCDRYCHHVVSSISTTWVNLCPDWTAATWFHDPVVALSTALSFPFCTVDEGSRQSLIALVNRV